MLVKKARVVVELNLMPLKWQFRTISDLQNAINDGTILSMLVRSADELHEGDFMAALRGWKRNLSSNVCTKKDDVLTADSMHDKARLNILRAYADELDAANAPKKVTLVGGIKKDNRWSLSEDEINAIPESDYDTCDSIYNSMHSYKSKHKEELMQDGKYDEYLRLTEVMADKRSKAAKLAKLAKLVPTCSDAILAKLAKGKGVTFTAEEAAELAKLFNK